MKKILSRHYLWVVLVISLIAILMYSCQNDDEKNEIVKIEASSVAVGDLTPVKLVKDGSNVRVTFLQSARSFSFNTNSKNGDQMMRLLTDAKDADYPVEVTVFEHTNTIASVKEATVDIIKAYRATVRAETEIETRGSGILTRASSSIIPSEQALDELFNELKNAEIPFEYATDGCYARAHKMRQIITSKGYECYKIFVYGDLAATNGECCVGWSYHVAPILRHRSANGGIEIKVLDPSLFKKPVSKQEWLNACKNRSCYYRTSISSVKITHGYVYVRSENGRVVTDDDYSKTECIISAYTGHSGCSTSAPFPRNCW